MRGRRTLETGRCGGATCAVATDKIKKAERRRKSFRVKRWAIIVSLSRSKRNIGYKFCKLKIISIFELMHFFKTKI